MDPRKHRVRFALRSVIVGAILIGLALATGFQIESLYQQRRHVLPDGMNAWIIADHDDIRFVDPRDATNEDVDSMVGMASFSNYVEYRPGFVFPTRRIQRRTFNWRFVDDREFGIEEEERFREAYRVHLLRRWPSAADYINDLTKPSVYKKDIVWLGVFGNGAIVLLMIGIPIVLVTALSIRLLPSQRRRRRLGTGRCPCCRYEIRGLPSCRCPECGETWSDDELPEHLRSYDPAQQKTS